MKITVIGASGLIGTKLVDLLTAERARGRRRIARLGRRRADRRRSRRSAERRRRARRRRQLAVVRGRSGDGVLHEVDHQPGGCREDARASATTSRCRSSASTGCPTAGTCGPRSLRRRSSPNPVCRTRSCAPRSSPSSPTPITDSMTVGDEVRVPDALIQPIAADDVAADVARAAVAEPLNGIVNIGGPEKISFEQMARDVAGPAGRRQDRRRRPAGRLLRHGCCDDAAW